MSDTVLDNTSTTASLAMNTSVYGRIDTDVDQDFYRVDLVAGQTYEFRLHGVGRAELQDPTLRLRDANGVELAYNDDSGTARWDGGNNRDSFIQFTATTSGAYYLDVGGFSDLTGDFLLTAANHNPAGMVFTHEEIAWQLTNNATETGGGRPASWGPGIMDITVNLTGLTSAGYTLAREALDTWESIIGLDFVETTGTANIMFDDNASGQVAESFYWVRADGQTIDRATVQVSTGWLSQYGTGFNSYSFETYIHEIGHALGLGHAGNYNGSATFANDAYYLNDSLGNSIMSYMNVFGDEFDQPGNNASVNPNVSADFRFMVTPGMADITAVRSLYNWIGHASDHATTYGFGSNTGLAGLDAAAGMGADMYLTVFDDGGHDNLNFSQTGAGQVINLNDGTYSDVLGGTRNLAIYNGIQIEDVYGGWGEDVLIGNELDNLIHGGAGVDEMWGGAGNDTFHVDNASDIVEEFAANGTNDRVNTTLTAYTLVGDVEFLDYQGPSTQNFRGTGNVLDNTIQGWNGNDTLDGKGGADKMVGYSGNDIYSVDNVRDAVVEWQNGGSDRVNTTLSAYTLADNVEVLDYEGPSTAGFRGNGNALDNTLQGWGGNDFLDGKGGADLMRGYGGNDTFYVDNAGDRIEDGSGTADRVIASVSYTLAAGQQVEILATSAAGTAAIHLTGNELAQSIYGNAGRNIINGAGGVDTLTGNGGNDTFRFSIGPSSGVDRIADFSAPDDTIQLYKSVFKALSAGTLDASAYKDIGDPGATVDANDRILYNDDTGALLYDSNGSDAGGRVQFATLLDKPATLTHADFFVA